MYKSTDVVSTMIPGSQQSTSFDNTSQNTLKNNIWCLTKGERISCLVHDLYFQRAHLEEPSTLLIMKCTLRYHQMHMHREWHNAPFSCLICGAFMCSVWSMGERRIPVKNKEFWDRGSTESYWFSDDHLKLPAGYVWCEALRSQRVEASMTPM